MVTIFLNSYNPNEMSVLRNYFTADSRCEIQTLPHVQENVNEKILDYLGHFYGWWENHYTIVKFGSVKGIQVE